MGLLKERQFAHRGYFKWALRDTSLATLIRLNRSSVDHSKCAIKMNKKWSFVSRLHYWSAEFFPSALLDSVVVKKIKMSCLESKPLSANSVRRMCAAQRLSNLFMIIGTMCCCNLSQMCKCLKDKIAKIINSDLVSRISTSSVFRLIFKNFLSICSQKDLPVLCEILLLNGK